MNIDQINRFASSRQCEICSTTNEDRTIYNGEQGTFTVACQNCGDYVISDCALADLMDHWVLKRPEYLPLLSHKIFRRQRAESAPFISSAWLREVFEGQLEFPTAFEQVENLVIFLAETLRPGESIRLNKETCQAAVGAADEWTLGWVIKSAHANGWVWGDDYPAANEAFSLVNATLSLSGWEWYNEIGRHKQSRIAFMAMKFGDDELISMVEGHFRPAVKETGFELRLLSDEPEAGLIDNRLRVEIRRSRLLIDDLSHHNNGAYWEAGFAEGLSLPVIYTCKKSVLEDKKQKIHFDTRNQLIVP